MTRYDPVLIDRYRYLAASLPRGSGSSEAERLRTRHALEELWGIARAIRDSGEEGLTAFAALLDEPGAAPWVAMHLVTVFEAGADLRRRALDLLKEEDDALDEESQRLKAFIVARESSR